MTNAYAKYKLQSFSKDKNFNETRQTGNNLDCIEKIFVRKTAAIVRMEQGRRYKILITFLIYEIIYFVLIHQSFLWNVIKLYFDSKDEMFLWNKGDGK